MTKGRFTNDMAAWQLRHTAKINETSQYWEDKGYTVFTENQNSFTLRGASARIGGKPDLIATKCKEGVIINVKTGRPMPVLAGWRLMADCPRFIIAGNTFAGGRG
jgi:hypothetical protein